MLATAQQGADEGRYGERSQIDQAAPNVERNDRGPLSLQLVPGASWMNFHNLGTRRDTWPRRRRSGALRRQ